MSEKFFQIFVFEHTKNYTRTFEVIFTSKWVLDGVGAGIGNGIGRGGRMLQTILCVGGCCKPKNRRGGIASDTKYQKPGQRNVPMT